MIIFFYRNPRFKKSLRNHSRAPSSSSASSRSRLWGRKARWRGTVTGSDPLLGKMFKCCNRK